MLTREQKQYIEDQVANTNRKHKDIAAEIGISRWQMSIYINKKRRYKQSSIKYFQVELKTEEHTWLI